MENVDIQPTKPATGEKSDFLPYEILLNIFGYLHLDDVLKSRLVCKRWNRSVDELWKKFVPKYADLDLPKAKSQKEIFLKMWSHSVQIGKERWYPNPLPGLVDHNTLLQKCNLQNIFNCDDIELSKCILYLRLNPVYPFTSDGIKPNDPLMQEIVHKISDKRGHIVRPDEESDEEVGVPNIVLVEDGTLLIDMNFFGDKKFIMETIVISCFDTEMYNFAELHRRDVFDEEGHILDKMLNDNEQVAINPITKGMSLSKKLFNQIWNIVVDNNDKFMVYCINSRYRNEDEEFPYGRQILVSDSAVVYCARRLLSNYRNMEVNC